MNNLLDPATYATSQDARNAAAISDLKRRVAILERGGGAGGSGISTLSGHVIGSPGSNTIATTAKPQIAGLGIGVAADADIKHKILAPLPTSSTKPSIAVSDSGLNFSATAGATKGDMSQGYFLRDAVNALAANTIQPTHFTYLKVKQGGDAGRRNVAHMVRVEDRSDVTDNAITAVNNTGGTGGRCVITISGSHSYVAGDQLTIYGATGSSNLIAAQSVFAVSGADITLDTTSVTGTYTGSGFATNRSQYYCHHAVVKPNFDRSIFSGATIFADDVACYVANNVGSSRGTDCFYVGSAGTVVGSEWSGGYTFQADCDFPFNVKGTIGADNSQTVFGKPYGAAFDCSECTFVTGAHAIRVGNNTNSYIVARNAAGTGYKTMMFCDSADRTVLSSDGQTTKILGAVLMANNKSHSALNAAGTAGINMGIVNAADEIIIGDTGTNNKLRVFRNNTEVFHLNSSIQVQMASGKRIGFNVDPSALIHTPASTSATDGWYLGADASQMSIYRRGANALQVANSVFTLSNNRSFSCRNAADSASVNLILFNGSDQIIIGDFGTNNELSFWRNNSKVFFLNSSGNIEVSDAKDITVGTTTGTKFGTSVTQKMGWWNATPVVRQGDYTVTTSLTTHSDLRSFDEDTVTLALLARVVATMIKDDQTYGLKGGTVT